MEDVASVCFLKTKEDSIGAPKVDVINGEGMQLSPEAIAEAVKVGEQFRVGRNGGFVELIDDGGVAQFSAQLL